MKIVEGDLEFDFPDEVAVAKFDDPTKHGLSCMSAVDFVIELEGGVFFIEVKDPQVPGAEHSEVFKKNMLAGRLNENLRRKYRDTFLYRWASEENIKNVRYYVIIAIEELDRTQLTALSDKLKREIPLDGPDNDRWKRKIVESCNIFNIETWNHQFPEWKIARLSRG